MNAISIFAFYAFFTILIGFGLLLFFMNFKSMLSFKWNIDYFYLKDRTCSDKKKSKLEIETYRYNTYRFTYNQNNEYDYLKNTYKTTFNIFIVYYICLIILLLVLPNFLNIISDVSDKTTTFASGVYNKTTTFMSKAFAKKNKDNPSASALPAEQEEVSLGESASQVLEGDLLGKKNDIKKKNIFDNIPNPCDGDTASILSKVSSGISFIFKHMAPYFTIYIVILIALGIVFITVNSIIYTNFTNIDKVLSNEDSNFYKYCRVYKILNAIMDISNLKNSKMLYSLDRLNANPKILDEIIENNISSYENESNVTKVQFLKLKYYEELDFVKYLVLDKLSPYYLKYFDNIYIRFPDDSTNQFDISENIYLTEMYTKLRDEDINFGNVNKLFEDIAETIKNNTDYSIAASQITEYIATNASYSTIEKFNEVSKLIKDIYRIANENKSKESEIYKIITNKLYTIQTLLTDKNYGKMYTKLNSLIHDRLHPPKETKSEDSTLYTKQQSDTYIPSSSASADNDSFIDKALTTPDYVQYFIQNKDILFEYDTSFDDIRNILDYQGNFLYAYIVYFAIIFLIIAHYYYIKINNITYCFIMLGVVFIYFIVLRMYKVVHNKTSK